MAEAFDPFWQAAASHVETLGIAPVRVFAPTGFAPLLPGCRTAAAAQGFEDLAALVLHKGRLEEVPPEILLGALDAFAPTFANEVFIVLSASGTPLAPDSRHLMGREALLAAALRAHHRKSLAPAAGARSTRTPATYMGQGRVLLETAFGHLMLVDGGDTAIVPHLIRDGWFDRNLTEVITGLLVPGMTFIDIGANFGTYSLIAAAEVGETGRVIAIEPAPPILALLGESVVMNGFAGHCDVLPVAVGAAEGVLTLYRFATRQGSNTMLADIAETAQAEYGEAITAVEVPSRTLDAIVAERGLARCDLVKIDVEGFEDQVLAGARETLSRFRPRLILEWHNGFFAGRPQAARDLHDLLTRELGYTLHRIGPGATSRAIAFEELLQHGHSDLLALPAGE